MTAAPVGPHNSRMATSLRTRRFTRDEVEKLLDAGRIEDGFTALALMYYLRRA